MLCGVGRRCWFPSTHHCCPESCRAAGNPTRCWDPAMRWTSCRGRRIGKGVTAAPSHWSPCWTNPWSREVGRLPGYTGTAAEPLPVAFQGREVREAGRPPFQLWPSGYRWHGRSIDCRPLLLPQRLLLIGTGAILVWAAEFQGHGIHWWSSYASSTWHACSGTRPALWTLSSRSSVPALPS